MRQLRLECHELEEMDYSEIQIRWTIIERLGIQ